MSNSVMPNEYIAERRISASKQAKLTILASYDLSRMTSNFIDKGRRFSPEQVWPIKAHFGKADLEIATALEIEFKRFVALTILEPGRVYAPSGPVDMYWHFFVLHTREYKDFCTKIWGQKHDHGALPKDLADSRSMAPLPTMPVEADATFLFRNISILPQKTIVSLNADVLQKIYLLEHWDLSFFTERLLESDRFFSPEQIWPIKAHFGRADTQIAKMLEWEFKKFVALTLLDDNMTLAPSGPVDMYWHFFILHTKEYRDFCNTIWRYYQHHPRGSRSEDERGQDSILLPHNPIAHENRNDDSFTKLLSHYEEVYGKADASVWCHPDTEIRSG